jgi:transposase
VITDLHGVPLAVWVTPANWRDDKAALELFNRLNALPDDKGNIWHRPVVGQGDRGYGYCQVMLPLMLGGIDPLMPLARDTTHGSGLGKIRFVVERTLSWFKDYRRIAACYERCGRFLQAFHDLAAALICLKRTHCIVSHF